MMIQGANPAQTLLRRSLGGKLPHELALGDDVVVHGLDHNILGGAFFQIQRLVEGIELEVIAMSSGRRRGAAVTELLEIVLPLNGALNVNLPAWSRAQFASVGGNVEQHPVDPGAA